MKGLLIIELHIEIEKGDMPSKLVIAELDDPKLWTEILGRITDRKQGKAIVES